NCDPLPDAGFGATFFTGYDDLVTDGVGGDCAGFPGGACGIFSAVLGTAPNRTFVLEVRSAYYTGGAVSYEALFQENSPTLSVIYGPIADTGQEMTTGVQASAAGPATTYSCGTPSLTNGLRVNYVPQFVCPGATPTNTPTNTPSNTPTNTP